MKSAMICVNGDERRVEADSYLTVNIACGPLGVMKIQQCWKEDDETYFRAVLFFKPQTQDGKDKKGEQYGEVGINQKY